MLSIAIDGPSGAGKSTVAKIIAKKLNIIHLDTGAMYRAIGLKAHLNNVDCSDSQNIEKMLLDTDLKINFKNGEQFVILDGIDVSQDIRQHFVSKIASDVSKLSCVRDKLVDMQRIIASQQNIVLDGRDITTNVLVKSKNKFFLTADAEKRADRRFKELTEKGSCTCYEEILKDIIDRDYNDMNRKITPLKISEDSVIINCTNMTAEEVADFIIANLKKE